jgi:hypothetical protein
MYKKILLTLLIISNNRLLSSVHKEISLPEAFEVKTSTKIGRAVLGVGCSVIIDKIINKLSHSNSNDNLPANYALLAGCFGFIGYTWLTSTEVLLKDSDHRLKAISKFEIIQQDLKESNQIVKRANEIYGPFDYKKRTDTYRHTETSTFGRLFPSYAAHLQLAAIEQISHSIECQLEDAGTSLDNGEIIVALGSHIKTAKEFKDRANTMKSALSTHDSYKKEKRTLQTNGKATKELDRFYNVIPYK